MYELIPTVDFVFPIGTKSFREKMLNPLYVRSMIRHEYEEISRRMQGIASKNASSFHGVMPLQLTGQRPDEVFIPPYKTHSVAENFQSVSYLQLLKELTYRIGFYFEQGFMDTARITAAFNDPNYLLTRLWQPIEEALRPLFLPIAIEEVRQFHSKKLTEQKELKTQQNLLIRRLLAEQLSSTSPLSLVEIESNFQTAQDDITIADKLSLSEVLAQLSQDYKRRAVIIEIGYEDKPISIDDDTFISLAVVTRRVQQEKEAIITANDRNNPDNILNTWEQLQQVEYPIAIEDLWQKNDKDPFLPQRIIIEGQAGVGKTVLCGNIIRRWANKQLWNDLFDWILYIPLRNLYDKTRYPILKSKDYTLKDVLQKECFPWIDPSSTILEQIVMQLTKDSSRALYLLDGFDEIADYETAVPQLAHIIQDLLHKPRTLVTTRPGVTDFTRIDHSSTRCLITLGFSNAQVYVYIDKYAKRHGLQANIETNEAEHKVSHADELCDFLRGSPWLFSICHTPLHLELVCLAWFEKNKDATLPNPFTANMTVTQLYNHIIDLLLDRYLERNKVPLYERRFGRREQHPLCQAILPFLEHLAFHSMSQGNIILNTELIAHSLDATHTDTRIIKQLINSGFVKPIATTSKEQAYVFLHLNIHELFAARHFAKLWIAANIAGSQSYLWLNQHKLNPRYAVMIWFIAGQLKNMSADLELYLQTLTNKPRDEIGLQLLMMLVRCLEESELAKQADSTWIKQFNQYLCDYTHDALVAVDSTNPDIINGKVHTLKTLFSTLQFAPCLTQQLGDVTKLLVAATDETIPTVRYRAILLLCFIPSQSPNFLDILAANLRRIPETIRTSMIRALLKNPSLEKVINTLSISSYPSDNIERDMRETLKQATLTTNEIAWLLDIILDEEKDSPDRKQAMTILSFFEPPSTESVVVLLDIVRDIEDPLRPEAINIIASLPHPSSEIIEVLTPLLDYASLNFVELMKKCEEDDGKNYKELTLAAMSDLQTDRIKNAAISAFVKWRSALTAPLLRKLLQAGCSVDRPYNLMVAFKKWDNPTADIIAVFVDEAAHSKNKWIIEISIGFLSTLKKPSKEVIEALQNIVLDDARNEGREERFHNDLLRSESWNALGRIINDDPTVFEFLLTLLNNPKRKKDRCSIIDALSNVSHPSAELIQNLLDIVTDNDITRSTKTIMLSVPSCEVNDDELALKVAEITKMQLTKKNYLEAIKKHADSQAGIFTVVGKMALINERAAALKALGQLQYSTDNYTKILFAALKDESYKVQCGAIVGLCQSLRPTEMIIETLISMYIVADQTSDEASDERYDASSIGLLDDRPNEAIAIALIQGLERWINDSNLAREFMLNAIKNDDCTVREKALQALGKILLPSWEVIKVLVTPMPAKFNAKTGGFTQKYDETSREKIVRTIGKQHPLPVEQLSGLLRLLKTTRNTKYKTKFETLLSWKKAHSIGFVLLNHSLHLLLIAYFSMPRAFYRGDQNFFYSFIVNMCQNRRIALTLQDNKIILHEGGIATELIIPRHCTQFAKHLTIAAQNDVPAFKYCPVSSIFSKKAMIPSERDEKLLLNIDVDREKSPLPIADENRRSKKQKPVRVEKRKRNLTLSPDRKQHKTIIDPPLPTKSPSQSKSTTHFMMEGL
jgi:hypothetical protein